MWRVSDGSSGSCFEMGVSIVNIFYLLQILNILTILDNMRKHASAGSDAALVVHSLLLDAAVTGRVAKLFLKI